MRKVIEETEKKIKSKHEHPAYAIDSLIYPTTDIAYTKFFFSALLMIPQYVVVLNIKSNEWIYN
jgi:hypothetical protein